MLLLSLAACTAALGPPDAQTARRWAERHETTFRGVDARAAQLLAQLPSLPGDAFTCRETIAPPGSTEAVQASLRESLCRQQEAAWRSERHEAEEDLGVELLNGAFQSYGVVGVALSIAGPNAEVEWADHRGVWAVSGEGAVSSAAAEALPWGDEGEARVGWGQVTLAEEPVWAVEWRRVRERRSATATVRVVLLADGTPDAAFVRRAMGTEDDPPPVRIPVQLPD